MIWLSSSAVERRPEEASVPSSTLGGATKKETDHTTDVTSVFFFFKTQVGLIEMASVMQF